MRLGVMARGLAALSSLAACIIASVALASVVCAGQALAVATESDEGSPLAFASPSAELTTQAETGWQGTSEGMTYLIDGKRVTGLHRIDGALRYFSSTGIMSTGDTNVGGATFYINGDGTIFGAKYNNTYYYDTLKPMTGDDSYDFDTYLWARSIVASITNPWDDSETKLHKAFDWVMYKYYAIHYPGFNSSETNWMARYARYHFANESGDCHSDAAAFAYLAAAIGYPADACIDAYGTSSHSWTMIGNKVYDPLFAQSKSYWGYYGVTSGTYEIYPTARYRVPTYNPSHNSSAAVCQELVNAGMAGLKKKDGKLCYYENGELVRDAWRTIDGKRYYFKSDGSAATLSTKIGDVYYVFNTQGVLQNSAESGKRIVTIAGESYQVVKSGMAMPGWSADKQRYALTNGRIVKSAWKTIDGKRYYFRGYGYKAVESLKIEGVYYVFGKSGALMRSTNKASQLVRVSGHTYRVDKKGRAVKGWSDDYTQRFDKRGMLLTGVHLINGKFYAAGNKGRYLPELTDQLRAAVKGFDADDPAASKVAAYQLRMALGTPIDEAYTESCNIKGHDGVWVYDHVMITTARPKGVKSIDEVVAQVEAADKAAAEKAAAVKAFAEKAYADLAAAEKAFAEKAAAEEAEEGESATEAGADGEGAGADSVSTPSEGADGTEGDTGDAASSDGNAEAGILRKLERETSPINLDEPYEYLWSIKAR